MDKFIGEMRTEPQRWAESLRVIAERIITIISFLCGTQGVFTHSGAGIIKTVRYCKQFHPSKMVYAKLS